MCVGGLARSNYSLWLLIRFYYHFTLLLFGYTQGYDDE